MPTNREQPVLVGGIDIGPLLRKGSIPLNRAIRTDLADTREELQKLEQTIRLLDAALRSLEAADNLGFEIQDAMSAFNAAESLAANIAKKRDSIANAILSKIA
jgi:hypothetical protein